MRIAVVHGDLRKPYPHYPNQDWSSNDNGVMRELHAALGELAEHRFTFFSDHDTLWADLERRRAEIELVLNLCDDGFMNDPDRALHVCAMLDLLELPYTGSGVAAMAMTADKQVQLCVAEGLGVRVPRSVLLALGQPVPDDLSYPVIVKPNTTDGSVGIEARSVARDAEGVSAALCMMRDEYRLSCAAVLQEYLPGKDVCVSLLGNAPDGISVLPITEEDYSALPDELPKICGYEAKWLKNSPYWQIKTQSAALSASARAELVAASRKLFTRFRLRDYARFDFRLDASGAPVFLEANANCGWCWDGHLAKAASFAGMSYADLLRAIMAAAAKRLALGQGS
jgi:D-alanine-D-alanine ligase